MKYPLVFLLLLFKPKIHNRTPDKSLFFVWQIHQTNPIENENILTFEIRRQRMNPM